VCVDVEFDWDDGAATVPVEGVELVDPDDGA
jgi:hypothetical protein